jgi:hypothetical protein
MSHIVGPFVAIDREIAVEERVAPDTHGVVENPQPRSPTMSKKARITATREPFASARQSFDELIHWLSGPQAPRTEAAIEDGLFERGMEVLRQLLETKLQVLFERERVELLQRGKPEGVEVRARSRHVESRLGRVKMSRLGWTRPGEKTRFPLDAQLELPAELYSEPLQERVADEARVASFDHAVSEVDKTTAGHVPKRQAQQIVVNYTQDFDEFNKQKEQPANDALSEHALLCGSSDSKGVRMLPQALREATRKEWEQEQAEAVRGDPMAQKKARQHDKRMAIVTANWEQEPQLRTADDVVRELGRKPTKRRRRRRKSGKNRPGRPQNKRVSASVIKSQAQGIAEMLDDADRRDPKRERELVTLIDGEEHQQTNLLDEAARRGRMLKIVLDLIHVIHYLWLAGWAINGQQRGRCEAWMLRFVRKLLTLPVEQVMADIRRAALARGLSGKQLKPVNKCLRYFTRNADFMRYSEFLAAGLPIATGIIEGACRYLVQDRLGITGARWDLPGAEAILRLRSLHASGDWEEYRSFHRQREAERNYAAAA